MDKKLEDMTPEELKAIGYDQFVQLANLQETIRQVQQNINLINAELSKRQPQIRPFIPLHDQNPQEKS